jgi:hypothetical protein
MGKFTDAMKLRAAGEAAQQTPLLEQLLAEQRRTNQLLEWTGGLLADTGQDMS